MSRRSIGRAGVYGKNDCVVRVGGVAFRLLSTACGRSNGVSGNMRVASGDLNGSARSVRAGSSDDGYWLARAGVPGGGDNVYPMRSFIRIGIRPADSGRTRR
jgi:hypothetical protein